MTSALASDRDHSDERREEAAWVARIQAGDRDSARRLFERYASRVRAYTRHHVADPERAKDISQSAMLALLRAIRDGRLEDVSRPGAYLFGACRRLVAGRPVREEPVDDLERFASSSDPEAEAERRILIERVETAIATLSPGDQEVLYARLGQDLTHEHIAERLRIPAPTARKRYDRALKRLIAALGGDA